MSPFENGSQSNSIYNVLDKSVVIRVIILDNVESTRIKTQRDKNPSFNSNLVFDIGERLADETMTHQNDNIYDKGFLKRNPNNKTQFVDSVNLLVQKEIKQNIYET